MYTESKTTRTVKETVSFYFRLCSMIYLFLSGVTNNWSTSQLTNQLTTHQVTNNHNRQAEASFSLHKDTTPPQPNHTVTPTHIEPEQYNT